MNSIARPRSRPRKASVNFRSLWWVVTREAYLRIAYYGDGWRRVPGARERLAALPTWRVRQKAERILFFNEARRYYP